MYANFDLVSSPLFRLRPLLSWHFNQPFLLTDPHRFNPNDKPQEDDSLLFLEILPHLQLQASMGCQSRDHIAILPIVETRE